MMRDMMKKLLPFRRETLSGGAATEDLKVPNRIQKTMMTYKEASNTFGVFFFPLLPSQILLGKQLQILKPGKKKEMIQIYVFCIRTYLVTLFVFFLQSISKVSIVCSVYLTNVNCNACILYCNQFMY